MKVEWGQANRSSPAKKSTFPMEFDAAHVVGNQLHPETSQGVVGGESRDDPAARGGQQKADFRSPLVAEVEGSTDEVGA